MKGALHLIGMGKKATRRKEQIIMRVKQLLDSIGRDVDTVSPDETVYDALALMAKKEIGALVVLEKKKMVGIISERDYARKVILKEAYAVYLSY